MQPGLILVYLSNFALKCNKFSLVYLPNLPENAINFSLNGNKAIVLYTYQTLPLDATKLKPCVHINFRPKMQQISPYNAKKGTGIVPEMSTSFALKCNKA